MKKIFAVLLIMAMLFGVMALGTSAITIDDPIKIYYHPNGGAFDGLEIDQAITQTVRVSYEYYLLRKSLQDSWDGLNLKLGRRFTFTNPGVALMDPLTRLILLIFLFGRK